MANHSLPTLTSTYTNFIGEVGGRIDDAVRQNRSDTVTLTNPPVGTIRWNAGSNRWESNTGTAGAPVWSALAASYGISITGNAATVTNGVYSVGDQTIGGIKTFTSNIVASGGITGTLNGNATGTSSGVSVAGTAAITATGANPVTINTNGTERVRVDAAGNMGLGVAPVAWGGVLAGALELKNGSAIASQSNTYNLHLIRNAYFDGSWRYKNSAPATRFALNNDAGAGGFSWYYAGSGVAGSALNWIQGMTLDLSGYLLLGAAASEGAGAARFQMGDASAATSGFLCKSTSSSVTLYASSTASSYLAWRGGSFMAFGESPDNLSSFVERARFDASGNWIAASGVTGHWQVPRGTTAERTASPASGMIRFNTTLGRYEGHNGTAWSSIGGGATGGGSDDIFMENGQTVTTNYTITAGKNALSAGPITIANGITVTVPSGSTWVIA